MTDFLKWGGKLIKRNSKFIVTNPTGGGEVLGPEKLSGWTNDSTPWTYETFTSSSMDITSAINAAGGEGANPTGQAYTNTYTVNGATTYKLVIDVTVNSGEVPRIMILGNYDFANHILSSGVNTIYHVTDPSETQNQIYVRNYTASNFSATFSSKEVL